jgi:hypothetical protein
METILGKLPPPLLHELERWYHFSLIALICTFLGMSIIHITIAIKLRHAPLSITSDPQTLPSDATEKQVAMITRLEQDHSQFLADLATLLNAIPPSIQLHKCVFEPHKHLVVSGISPSLCQVTTLIQAIQQKFSTSITNFSTQEGTYHSIIFQVEAHLQYL